EGQTGIDLLHEEMESLSNNLAEHMNLNKSMARMDSLMVASSCKNMSRLELVYTVIRNMVRTLNQTEGLIIPEAFTKFLEYCYENEILYHFKSNHAQLKLAFLIKLAFNLFYFLHNETNLQNIEAFKHLTRLLNEQCVQMEDGTFIGVERNK